MTEEVPEGGSCQETFEHIRRLVLGEGGRPRIGDAFRQAVQYCQQRWEQMVGNWCRFEPVMTQPAGQGATVDLRIRNGNRVNFSARRIKLRKLLEDMKSYLKSAPKRLSDERFQLENLGHWLLTRSGEKYLGAQVAHWHVDPRPRSGNFDRSVTITTPLEQPGAYLLTANMVDGNTDRIVLWVSDTAIVRKSLESKVLYYVADAVTGKPLAKCNVELFGYWQEHLRDGRQGSGQQGIGNDVVHTMDFAERTDENGLVELTVDDNNRRYQWIAIATTPKGRLAYLGFRGVWGGRYRPAQYEQVKALAITDRPVYRPGQRVQYKFWVRHARYGSPDKAQFAGQSFQIEIRDPRNQRVFSTTAIADRDGGLVGEWELPAETVLGQYRLHVVNHGGGTFRVAEYKKPAFEVRVDSPRETVLLGEKVWATITARDSVGAPVIRAKVKYKVYRCETPSRWYPPGPWDWLYGVGYGWLTEDCPWYPGWKNWGCVRPARWWTVRAPNTPELVAERDVTMGPAGTVEVEIDTVLAKAMYPSQDQRYRIVAEVVDASRRTVVGSGTVLVTRQPFRVSVWTDRGYYRAGDTIETNCSARTRAGKPVVGSGVLRLLAIHYENEEPVESEVSRWDLPTNAKGTAELQIKASAAGHYRLAYTVTGMDGEVIEGGHLLTITGAGFDGSAFRFNDIELIPDRRTYQPGDKVALLINTNQVGAMVLLFERPAQGVYQPPRVVRMHGKSTVVEIGVTGQDTPNFFVEAITVHGGQMHVITREILVPPVQRMTHVEVVPAAEAYLPGQTAKVLLKLTDDAGKPVVGSTALTIYDQALERSEGGSNVPDIREFFWKWRRNHQPRSETNLDRGSGPRARSHEPIMHNLVQAAEQDILLVPPVLRQQFADTALWVASLDTNAEGVAEVELDMPEKVATWMIRVWSMGAGTRVGQGKAEVVTRKRVGSRQ